jgi:hypothetical protein
MRRRARVRYGAARGRCPTRAEPGPSHRSSSLGWDWGRIGNDDIAFKTFVEPGTPNSAPADTTPPNACISSGPSGLVNDDTPTFGFSGSDDMTT